MKSITREKAIECIRQIETSIPGKTFLDYLVQEGGFYTSLFNQDPRLEARKVAERDFVVRNIVELLKEKK